MTCKCCETERSQRGAPARKLVPIPFKEKAEPAWLCGLCDGDALSMAYERLKRQERRPDDP